MSVFSSKILLAIDGSPEAGRAARTAVALANGLVIELPRSGHLGNWIFGMRGSRKLGPKEGQSGGKK